MKKILIVEDDFYIRDIYKICFEGNGYEADTVDDGDGAIEKTKNTLYDMILLDVMLPKMNGIEVLKVLRSPNSSHFKVPIFLISNLGQEDVVKEALKIGANDYILKANLTPQMLVEKISAYFEDSGSK